MEAEEQGRENGEESLWEKDWSVAADVLARAEAVNMEAVRVLPTSTPSSTLTTGTESQTLLGMPRGLESMSVMEMWDLITKMHDHIVNG